MWVDIEYTASHVRFPAVTERVPRDPGVASKVFTTQSLEGPVALREASHSGCEREDTLVDALCARVVSVGFGVECRVVLRVVVTVLTSTLVCF